jgi:sigma-E factor negative regulatory protein RseB
MFLDQPIRGLASNSEFYKLKLRERQRIAELNSQRLDIIAMDPYRYGYSLWMEAESGLLLKWQLTDQNGEALAKLVFTDLKMGSEVDKSEFKHDKPEQEQVPTGLPVGAAKSVSEKLQWQPGWLPGGFRITANRAPTQQSDRRFQHVVYSDGIASVSLYVEPVEKSAGAGLGLHRLGTSHVYGRKTDDVFVTVVGDVPAVTVEKIAKSVNLSNP